jgi:hypothetical protein
MVNGCAAEVLKQRRTEELARRRAAALGIDPRVLRVARNRRFVHYTPARDADVFNRPPPWKTSQYGGSNSGVSVDEGGGVFLRCYHRRNDVQLTVAPAGKSAVVYEPVTNLVFPLRSYARDRSLHQDERDGALKEKLSFEGSAKDQRKDSGVSGDLEGAPEAEEDSTRKNGFSDHEALPSGSAEAIVPTEEETHEGLTDDTSDHLSDWALRHRRDTSDTKNTGDTTDTLNSSGDGTDTRDRTDTSASIASTSGYSSIRSRISRLQRRSDFAKEKEEEVKEELRHRPGQQVNGE